MKSFIRKYAGSVRGVLSGFDRLVLRGSLRSLAFQLGIMGYLWREQVLLKDFARHAEQTTALLKEGSLAKANKLGREIRYLPSSQTSKEDVAREIARRDGITDGLICVLSCVEPCQSFEIFRNRDAYRLELRPRFRKCLHLYHYYLHPTFGFMHARLQTWFPFTIQVCLNGREWLARQMDRAGLAYRQRDNSFTWLEDVDKAQALMSQQVTANWPRLLQGIVRDIHPRHGKIFARSPLIDYRWSVHQSEWASDVLFRSRAALEAVYPRLIHHAITTFGSVDVMRFLGHKLTETGQIPPRFAGEVKTDVRERAEGIRIKHWVDANSLKLYDKGSVLRPEFTMNNPSPFKVLRPKEGEPDGPCAWRPLRKSIEDLPRRAALCQAANERYLEALSSVTDETPLKELVEPLCQPVATARTSRSSKSKAPAKTRRVRALNPLAPADAALLEAVARLEHVVGGFRNRDLCQLLFADPPQNDRERRRRSAQISRKLLLLRSHGLIRKIAHTHRYLLTANGRQAITSLLAARNASTEMLTRKAS
jgi:hypothetical protein